MNKLTREDKLRIRLGKRSNIAMFFRAFSRLHFTNLIKIGVVAFFVLGSASSFAQNAQNLSNLRVDELSDTQIRQFIQQVEAQGLTEAQLEQVAAARGMAPAEVAKLRERVNRIKQQGNATGNQKGSGASTTSAPSASSGGTRGLNYTPDTIAPPAADASSALESLRPKIFGSELFKNSQITFEPNLRLATPSNYQLGPDDELVIDIYGYSEANYRLRVSPEGTINIPYVGILSVGGLTMEQATQRIRARLSGIYSNIKTGHTKVAISLGNIRSIKVTLLGEVTRPGTYTLPSLATVFNALYSSGGPAENGSFRAIEVIRNGKVAATIDVYDFLLRGYQKNNIRLQDQDVIRIPTYKKRVQFTGEVKRPAIYEAVGRENLQDVINFAGGFTSEAYTARIRVIQNTAKERRVSDVFDEEFASYIPQNGDKYFAEPILERYENRVTITGAVFRPGEYQLESGLTLSQLIKRAEGVTEDAFLTRGYLTRLRADNTNELLSFDLGRILSGAAADIKLQREDQITISSIFDLREEYKVTIEGEIRSPGTFDFAENLTLEDLVVLAGGFKEGASPKRIEISRRVKDSEAGAANSRTARVFQVDIDQNLKLQGAKFVLQPFDIVVVRNAAGYETQRQVRVEGEVLYPGTYTISRKDERISDLVKRAGGLTDLAYLNGASLKRNSIVTSGSGKNKISTSETAEEKEDRLKRLQNTVSKDSTINIAEEVLRNDFVGINLDRIIERPYTKYDLILEEGDVLRIPKQLQTVKVNGEVLSPVTVVYSPSRGFKGYISSAGGFSQKALKKRAYVLYANGTVQATKKFLFFNNYPVMRPGAEIFVPAKAEKRKLTASETIGLASAVASLGAIAFGIINSILK